MRITQFEYSLPRELVAQTPLEPRDHSRLMVLDRSKEAIEHRNFYDLPLLLEPGDLLVLNDSRVMPARLIGKIAGNGGEAELLLLRREKPGLWQCLARPGRRLRPGTHLIFQAELEARITESMEGGLRLVEFNDESLVEKVGQAPLPPYIRETLQDPERYQTVYASSVGSAAAPTAGLHFTEELMQDLQAKGVQTAFLTLHVGLDTFRPVDEDDPRKHKLHTEYWEVSPQAAESINSARHEGRRIVAVGTTSVRVLEQTALLMAEQGRDAILPGSDWADLFILPGHRFRAVDAMITNFHLPRSTLLMLVSAFAGRERVLAAYREAIERRYRFYSFGDAMLIV